MKKKSVFYKIYFAVIIVFLVLLISGLAVLYNWLGRYERTQPATIVTTLISDYLDSGFYSKLLEDYDIKTSEFETQDNLERALSEALDSKTFTYGHSSLKPKGADLAYTIKADDDKVLNVYLKKHRLDNGYDVSSIELSKNMYRNIEIITPAGTEISVNGFAVPDEMREKNEYPSLPEGVDLLTLTPTETIRIDGLITEPEVAATENGKTSEIAQDENRYLIAQHIDEEVAAKVKDISEKAAVAYSAYMQRDGNFGTLAQYCDTSTSFYKKVAGSLTMFVRDHNGYKNEDMSVTDLTKYSDNLYSCHVKFRHTLLLQDSTYSDNFDKVVFVMVNGNTYKVIDMMAYVPDSDE